MLEDLRSLLCQSSENWLYLSHPSLTWDHSCTTVKSGYFFTESIQDVECVLQDLLTTGGSAAAAAVSKSLSELLHTARHFPTKLISAHQTVTQPCRGTDWKKKESKSKLTWPQSKQTWTCSVPQCPAVGPVSRARGAAGTTIHKQGNNNDGFTCWPLPPEEH